MLPNEMEFSARWAHLKRLHIHCMHIERARALAYKNFIGIYVDRENHMLPRRRYVSPTKHQAHFTINTIDVRTEWVRIRAVGARDHETFFAAKWGSVSAEVVARTPFKYSSDAVASVNESPGLV